MNIDIKYVNTFTDRHGKVRHYFRHHGKRISLPGVPGSAEFMAAYQAALTDGSKLKPKADANRIASGSVRAAVTAYYRSTEYLKLAPSSRVLKRSELERFCSLYGDHPIRLLKWEHIDAIVASKIDKPGACWNFMIAVRGLVKYCMKAKLLTDDPTRGVERPPLNPDRRATWKEEHIAKFEKAYPIGTKERLALALALYTALRREDLVILGPQHIIDGVLYITPQKTRNKTGITLAIPVHRELAAVLEQTPTEGPTFLRNAKGEPFSPNVFTSWFLGVRRAAGIPDGLSIHGLRKACCRRLAEAECTAHEIMAISGHTTLKEVERYTRAAERARMARNANKKVARAFSSKTTTETSDGKPSGLGLPASSITY